jgi:predicted AlkP superfamily pyrophosphatase or phosphodiesterase
MVQSNGKVLFILLDAFRHDYINAVDTPFLFEAARNGIYAKKLKSTTGFTQRTAILTGCTAAAAGMFTMYTFDRHGSPFGFLENSPKRNGLDRLSQWVEKVPAVTGLRRVKRLILESQQQRDRIYRQWIQNEAKKHAAHASPAFIPLALLPYIGISEDNRSIHLPRALEQETIFDVFAREGVEYKFLMFPAFNCEDQAVLQLFLREARSSVGVILGQFSDSDLLIHHCGPSSAQRRSVVGEIDRRLREIAACYGDDVTWVIIGDHGMTDVIEEVDVAGEVTVLEKSARAKHGRDYLLFLDSTMARFHCLTDKGRRFVSSISEAKLFQQKGTFIHPELAARYSIPFGDRRYGDVIWWANLGTIIFPDYFHDRYTHNKGMHGYDSEHDDMKGFFLAFGPDISSKIVAEAHLIDVCASLCAAVGVGPPASNEGASLLS